MRAVPVSLASAASSASGVTVPPPGDAATAAAKHLSSSPLSGGGNAALGRIIFSSGDNVAKGEDASQAVLRASALPPAFCSAVPASLLCWLSARSRW